MESAQIQGLRVLMDADSLIDRMQSNSRIPSRLASIVASV